MIDDMDDDGLKQLKKRLYKKGEAFEKRGERTRIYGKKEKIPPAHWRARPPKRAPSFRPLKILFALAGIFFVVSVSALVYFFVKGSNVVSSRNIAMEIKGPSLVSGGEEVSLDIIVENKNNGGLESADLVIDFPDGSFAPDGSELSRERRSLGKIAAGGAAKETIGLNLFGKEDEEKKLSVTLEYRLARSNAIFAKTIDYTLRISRPAVGVSVSLPEETNAGREMEVKIGIVSNSESPIKNLLLKIDYPSGFQFSGAVPEPAEGNNVWKVGAIGPSQERSVTIRGIAGGQDMEEKSFRVVAGVDKGEGAFLAYGSAVASFVVKRPFLDLVLFVNGRDSADNAAFAGDSLRLDLVWKNNLTASLRNASLEVKIRGKALDEKSISVSGGFYRTFDKTLVWTPSSLPGLASIMPGEEGRAKFSFSVLKPLPVKRPSDKNFIIELEGKIKGRSILGGEESSEITGEVKKEIKVASRPQLASMALHYSGPIKNTGPMPPKAGEETTYTIVWSLGNAVNALSDVKVTAGLPSYARWTGKILPRDANISFNEERGEVVWDAGSVPPGTGLVRPAKEVAFQVALAPSVSQIGSSPILMGKTILEAKDNFINEILKEEKNPLTTRLFSDPKFKQEEAAVGE